MAPDHERYAQWDAAYVLGALDSAERREYEAHLEVCERCRAAIGALAPMPGLLGRLTAERAASIDADADADADTDPDADSVDARPDVLAVAATPPRDLVAHVVARDRRRRRRRRLVGLAAALAVVAFVVAIPLTLARLAGGASTSPGSDTAGGGTPAIALDRVVDSSLSASVHLTPEGWGTRIDMDCGYGQGGATPPAGGWLYGLYVIDRDGEESQISTWRVADRDDVRLTASTALARDDIRRVEIRALPSGTALLGADPPRGG
ncbi:zf-HC2 domain-containing protein [Schumannella sp. 10F1B-5-1]|uniref:zf-HC2 domain-containing protein n=1 Tax=Schumannella sp. 10F1B-5-1 TaxID=2590780 RepID=UPI00113095A6|nr:zf-HC2 domain-containing protein [Schumannella sp. 10F1B-5-1]TPW70233.1 zf-HC2 domain-containing protein [Schumannella sp. 10F1B-5-1]